MNERVASSVLRAAYVMVLGCCCFACNRRFEYDVPRGGGAGDLGAGGQTLGGSASGGGGAGVAGSGAGASGAGESCGAGPACPAELHCVEGACYQCAGDADCGTLDLGRCDPTRHRCVQCLVAADCPGDSGCDPIANHCLRICGQDLPCPEDAHGCDEERMVCYACDEDYECEQSPLGSLCAPDGSGCVECRGSLGCDPPRYCDELTGRCVECRDGSDCASKLCDPKLHSCLPS